MVKTDEFALVRFKGDQARADAVYDDVPDPLVAEDIAEAIVHAIELPPHVNLDLVTIKPVAQAAPHKVIRGPADAPLGHRLLDDLRRDLASRRTRASARRTAAPPRRARRRRRPPRRSCSR